MHTVKKNQEQTKCQSNCSEWEKNEDNVNIEKKRVCLKETKGD